MRRALFAVVLLCLCPASAASARETEHILPIQEALESDLARERLYDVPLYFHDQQTPPVPRRISTDTAHRSTRGIFRSDRSSCQVAFLSALRVLQERAREAGADAVVEIQSVTMDQDFASATEYRCVAGTTVVRVGLQGVLVELEE